jgi:hypothetical protein
MSTEPKLVSLRKTSSPYTFTVTLETPDGSDQLYSGRS